MSFLHVKSFYRRKKPLARGNSLFNSALCVKTRGKKCNVLHDLQETLRSICTFWKFSLHSPVHIGSLRWYHKIQKKSDNLIIRGFNLFELKKVHYFPPFFSSLCTRSNSVYLVIKLQTCNQCSQIHKEKNT